MDLNYDEIRRIHRLEKNSSKLVEVDLEFYSELRDFLGGEKQEYFDSLKDLSSTKARDFTNLKKMVEEIFAMREKKLLNKVLVASRTGDRGEEHMASQEKRLFGELLVLLEKHNRLLNGIFSDGESEGSGKDLNTLSVEILSDIPVFVGGDMNEYGPFRKGNVVAIPHKIAKLLSAKKLEVGK